jgi:hypothetical protein
MPSVSIEFPLRRKTTAFGRISDPRISVQVRTLDNWIAYEFLIDTGAGFTLVSRDLADDLGLVWDELPPADVRGVGHTSTPARFGRLPLGIGDVSLTVRSLFVQRTDMPPILGRADFLDRFVLTIDAHAGRITLTAHDE